MRFQYQQSARKMERMREENLGLKLDLEHRINTLKEENERLKEDLQRVRGRRALRQQQQQV
jgi:cell shape-determining protein MreC